jgi:hypothetical protein
MTKVLSILVIIVFVIPFLMRAIFRFMFGNPSQQKRPPQQNRSSQHGRNASRTQQSSSKKKVISENEGEYVDYEEIRE